MSNIEPTGSRKKRGLGTAPSRLIGLTLFLGFAVIAAGTLAFPLTAAPADQLPPPKPAAGSSARGSQTPTTIPNLAFSGTQARGAARMLRLPGQPGVDANTVALYHFDAPNGNTAIDATGRYTATLHGNAFATSSGLYGGVLQLDGRDGPGSYVRTGNLGALDSGTIEAFVDFQTACTSTSDYFGIFSAGGEFGSNQPQGFWLGTDGFLKFKVVVDDKLYVADSAINPCRYLDGNGSKDSYFVGWGLPVEKALWPYETWRFHHVAGTWGPRGIEIWVDGVLHGVGFYVPDPSNPPAHDGYSCSPQQQQGSWHYPDCDSPPPGLVPGAYAGGLSPYGTFLIGCDSSATCFKGRIDEARISSIQRTFTTAVDPTVTPLPTWTPVSISGEYPVDSHTLALFHLNSEIRSPANNKVWEEVSQQYRNLVGQAAIVPTGRFGSALALDGNGSLLAPGNLGVLGVGTIELWVNLAGRSGTQPLYAAKQYYNSTGTVLEFGASHNGNISLEISDGTASYATDSGVTSSSLAGCWHHLAGTWGPRGLEIWIDGALRSANGAFTRGMADPVDDWSIGCDFAGTCTQGVLDEVRVSKIQRVFTPRALAGRANTNTGSRQPVAGGTPYYFPIIQIQPTPSATATSRCPFG